MTLVPRNSIEADDLKAFLMMAASELCWGDAANEIVMDIGCGLGLNSTIILVELFPKIRKVIAIDQASDLIKTAKLQNMSDQIEFHAADIQDLSTLSPWEESLIKVVSIDCFEWLAYPRNGFRGIYCLLRSGGTAAVMMNINSPYQDCLTYLLQNSNWRYTDLGAEAMYPRFPLKKMEIEEYEKMLQEIGFKVIQCQEFTRIFEYSLREDFFVKGMEFIKPLLIYIPEARHLEFTQDFFNTFTELHGFTRKGKPCIKYKSASILIRKP